ncbi:transposon-related protein [Staphylococcus aureus]|uniref:Transposon-related protein n=1 Tax=Staphylococcus aureus TaxID=1280 RepID=A0A8G2I2Z8_STAAU|nr:transposon-related protein [Staphylococcus aureus]
MDKKAYNLKRTFEQPIVMYEFTDKFRINKGFRLDFWATFLIGVVYIIFVILVFITACNYVDWWTYVYLLYGCTLLYNEIYC